MPIFSSGGTLRCSVSVQGGRDFAVSRRRAGGSAPFRKSQAPPCPTVSRELSPWRQRLAAQRGHKGDLVASYTNRLKSVSLTYAAICRSTCQCAGALMAHERPAGPMEVIYPGGDELLECLPPADRPPADGLSPGIMTIISGRQT